MHRGLCVGVSVAINNSLAINYRSIDPQTGARVYGTIRLDKRKHGKQSAERDVHLTKT